MEKESGRKRYIPRIRAAVPLNMGPMPMKSSYILIKAFEFQLWLTYPSTPSLGFRVNSLNSLYFVLEKVAHEKVA